MTTKLFEQLRNDPDMRDFECRHAWADSHLNSTIALQIRFLREQRKWTQAKLANEAEMAQPRISLLEDVNYSAWSISTLKKIASAYDLYLRVSFEEFGSLERELNAAGRSAYERRSFVDDPAFKVRKVVAIPKPIIVENTGWLPFDETESIPVGEPKSNSTSTLPTTDIHAKTSDLPTNVVPFRPRRREMKEPSLNTREPGSEYGT